MKSYILATALLSIAHAFTPAILGTSRIGHHANSVKTSALNLLPNQGCQLAAASAAALAKDTSQFKEVVSPVNAARELVSRIFNLPSEILKVPGDALDIDIPFALHHTNEGGDVAVFPIVGFTYVKLEDTMKVVPSVNAKGIINIQSMRKTRTEEVYGWFSPSCSLGSLYSDDDVAYCGRPEFRKEVHDSMEKIHPSEM